MIKKSDSSLNELLYLEKDARAFGFDWPNEWVILDQAIDECKEIREAIEKNERRERIQEEIGDLLHSAISLCVFAGFDVDETLAVVNHKFGSRMLAIKELTIELGLINLKGQSFDFMLELWRKAKVMAATDQKLLSYETYNNLCTQFYDLDKPTAPEAALNFYLAFAHNANGPIFEPMCGTGLYLIPMLERGLDIEGSDASQYMLSVCKDKCDNKQLKPQLHHQLLQQTASNKNYALIFIPSGSFGLMTDINEAKKCLKILHDRLLPNGKLVFEIETTQAVPKDLGNPKERCAHGKSGEKIRLTTVSSYHTNSQILTTNCRYEWIRNHTKVETEEENLRVRLYQPHEMDEWLIEVGFKDISRYGNYDHRASHADDEMIIYECEKRM